MNTRDVTRRGFLSGLAGAGLTTPVLGRSATVGVQPDPSNFPLVVTSKTNRFVREEITTTAYDLMLNGGSAMDAAILTLFFSCVVHAHQSSESSRRQNISCFQKFSRFVPQSSSFERQRRHERVITRHRINGNGRSSQMTVCSRGHSMRRVNPE